MQEEVKKLSEGKSFKEIFKIIYCLKNSSTKPTKDPPQSTAIASNGTSNGVNKEQRFRLQRKRQRRRGWTRRRTRRRQLQHVVRRLTQYTNKQARLGQLPRHPPGLLCRLRREGAHSRRLQSPSRQAGMGQVLKDLNLTPRQSQRSGHGSRGGGRGGNQGQGGRRGAGQQGNWPQQQEQFQGNPGMYSIQQQQVLPPPGMMFPPQIPGGGGGGCQCPQPNIQWALLGQQQQQPPPPQSPAVQQPGTCGQQGTFVLDPNYSQFRGRTLTSTCRLFGSRHWAQSQRLCLHTP